MDNAEGWNESTASISEANIKADRCGPEDVQDLQKRSVEKFQKDRK